MRRLAILIVSAILVGACGGDDSIVSDPGTEPQPTVVGSTVGTLPQGEPRTLWLGISIHVEGWKQEDTNQGIYQGHRDGLTVLAEAAAAHDARLTFELSQVFMDAHGVWGDTFVTDMQALGHGFGVHADIGGNDPAYPLFVDGITSMKVDLEAMGVDVIHVSGICSESPWVEAAIEAGYIATVGAVEYCLKSLDPSNMPAGKEHVFDCTAPGECHGAAVDDIVKRMYPWSTSTSADWLRPDPSGDLLILMGESGSALDCLSEADPVAGCTAEPADIDLFLATIEEYLALVGRFDRQPVLTISWSIGSLPSAEFADALFSAIDPYVADGRVAWKTIDEIAVLLTAR
jgi:hypothetical protein